MIIIYYTPKAVAFGIFFIKKFGATIFWRPNVLVPCLFSVFCQPFLFKAALLHQKQF